MVPLRLCSAFILALFFFVSFFSPSYSSDCSALKFSGDRRYEKCNDLPQFQSSFHWTYDAEKSSLSLAFAAVPQEPDGWISWAYNTEGNGMVGAQALIAFKNDGAMVVKQLYLQSYTSLLPRNLTYTASMLSAEATGGRMHLFATLELPPNVTTIHHVWQVGSAVVTGFPAKHSMGAANLQSKGTLELATGASVDNSGSASYAKLKNIHGILNCLSWGILFPVGILFAGTRTWESTDPAWFYLHVICQCSAYVLGFSGWATGLYLGDKTKGIVYNTHRVVGITVFSLATLQISAILVRPKKDHKYRKYWNIYHYFVAMTIVVLGIWNIFEGLHILDPEKGWKIVYVVVLLVLIAATFVLQVCRLIAVCRRK